MTLTDSTDIDSEDFWACGRAMGGYPGSFPLGFLQRIEEKFGIAKKDVLFPFGGAMPSQFDDSIGDGWVVNDIKKDLGQTTYDAANLPDKWEQEFDVVLCDPPYGEQNAKEIYGVEHPGYKNIYTNAANCVTVGGYLLILDYMVYINYANSAQYDYDMSFERQQPIAITSGPNQRVRILNIFKRTQ